ncbi:hypothetical protein R1sor_000492 [Riccia sorocarpa]|uniref:Reverse transcriptase zinc-binding domain-containing protein n=1 Tax=Riccia sorocarpa TaxID=122646 RepID=A0ABD3GT92_9MARC
MAVRRGRYDLSRLVHIYLSHGAVWVDHVREVVHHSTTVMSDHMPISVDIQIRTSETGEKSENYFKMNFYDLQDPGVLEKVQRAWKEELVSVRDDRRRWNRSWHRVKQVLKDVRAEKALLKKQESSLRQEVVWRKAVLTEGSLSEAEAGSFQTELCSAERLLKEQELQDARLWRIQSREKWLREHEVLYKVEEVTAEQVAARETLLALIRNKLSPEESQKMSAIPDKAKTEGVVFSMKTNKAPGIDGLTVEVLKWCWEFAGDDCVRLVHAKADSKRLENLCRDFVWGVTDEGRPKKAIVAWRRLAQEKARGGVGIRLFAERAQALQMRHACSILEGKDVEWVRIARRIMLTKLRIGPQKRERSGWDCSDAMLLLPAWRMPDIPTLDKILKTWFFARKFLQFDSSHLKLPADLPVRSLRVIWAMQEKPENEGFTWTESEARRNKISTVGELVINARIGGGVAQILASTFPDLLSWLVSMRTSDHKLVEGEGWMWLQGGKVERGWSASASFWLKRLGEKLWVWRILQHGFPTLDCAKKWGVSDGLCLFCLREHETSEHLFWYCPSLRQRTSWIGNIILGDRCGHPTLLQILDECLRDHKRAPAKFFLFVAHSQACWKERNLFSFEGKRSRQSETVLFADVEAQGKAFCFNLRGDKREQLLESFQSFVSSASTSISQNMARQADVADILSALGNNDDGGGPIWLQVPNTRPAFPVVDSSSSPSTSSSDSEETESDESTSTD